MKEHLAALLRHIVPFTEQETERVLSCFNPKKFDKNTIVLHEGETCREFYFVHKGCLRTYFLDKKGHEKTRYIITDCSVGTALTSFISGNPSFEFVEALEDSEVLVISRADFYQLNEEVDTWRLFYQKMLEMAYSFQNRKIESLVTLTARQRYEEVLRANPQLIQKLSNRILASYLDMTQETLSRLKSP